MRQVRDSLSQNYWGCKILSEGFFSLVVCCFFCTNLTKKRLETGAFRGVKIITILYTWHAEKDIAILEILSFRAIKLNDELM